jgi:hypothetical protein
MFGAVLFQAQLSLHAEWKQIVIQVNRPYPTQLIITARFDKSRPEAARTHALGIDDLSFSDRSVTGPFSCDFDFSSMCKWKHSPNPQSYTWSVISSRYWADRNLKKNAILKTTHFDVMYIEFDRVQSKEEARLVSELVQLPAGPHCLYVKYSSHEKSDIMLGVWLRDGRQLKEMASIKDANNEWQTWMVPLEIPGNSTSLSDAFELHLVATSGAFLGRDWLAIDSILYVKNECGDEHRNLDKEGEAQLDLQKPQNAENIEETPEKNLGKILI